MFYSSNRNPRSKKLKYLKHSEKVLKNWLDFPVHFSDHFQFRMQTAELPEVRFQGFLRVPRSVCWGAFLLLVSKWSFFEFFSKTFSKASKFKKGSSNTQWGFHFYFFLVSLFVRTTSRCWLYFKFWIINPSRKLPKMVVALFTGTTVMTLIPEENNDQKLWSLILFKDSSSTVLEGTAWLQCIEAMKALQSWF